MNHILKKLFCRHKFQSKQKYFILIKDISFHETYLFKLLTFILLASYFSIININCIKNGNFLRAVIGSYFLTINIDIL